MQNQRASRFLPRASAKSPPKGPRTVGPEVRAHLERAVRGRPSGTDAWLKKPDVPTAAEVASIVEGRLDNSMAPPGGIKEKGGWSSRAAFLKTQHDLLRYDTMLPQARAVEEVRGSTYLTESASPNKTRLYDKTFITGLTLARDGFAIEVEFSTSLAEKKILWAQSKRLKTGTAVMLTPIGDRFRTTCIVAIVASRRLSNIDVSPPRKPHIHLYIADPSQIEIDPQVEYLMVEASNGYWEASRHVLRALQLMTDERFPMAEHVVGVQPRVPIAKHVQDQPIMDLEDSFGEGFKDLNVLRDWPQVVKEGSTMDLTQMEALRRILTKQLAIIQGPPGTGKTFVSVQALRALVKTWKEGDPPIIVTAQTNHALDQLLRHINVFEPDFVRLGGQTTDKDNIAPRSLYSIKMREGSSLGHRYRVAKQEQKRFAKSLTTFLGPLMSTDPISPEVLQDARVISEKQCESFSRVERRWDGELIHGNDTAMGVFGEDHIVRFNKIDFRLLPGQVEELDEDELLAEEDLEGFVDTDDDKFEELKGDYFEFQDGWTTERPYDHSDHLMDKLLKENQDVSKIPIKFRGAIYAYLQRRLKFMIRERVRDLAKKYVTTTQELKIAKWESEHFILKNNIKIIGVTTTGLSKYRGLLTSLKPRIILIEEAAETLEAYIAAGCFESLQQLILVGDHQQLRPRTTMPEHAGNDINLDLSMFERLVNNGIEITQLKTQRRMHPEIRRLLSPIYPDLVDHPCVTQRERVRGMGKLVCHFFHHEWQESSDDALSRQNYVEAKLIEGFYHYLDQNEHPCRSITILTFYSGQKKLIRKLLGRKIDPRKLKVVTVDSYQGEENDIVILSTVRNNPYGNIGFLDDVHRVCVALSRARRGFYIFGNGKILCERNKKWSEIIIGVLFENAQLDDTLLLRCENHGTFTEIHSAIEFDDINGGCRRPCNETLPCGHRCQLKCHYMAHEELGCQAQCTRILSCGHPCSRLCSQTPCRCADCESFDRHRQVKAAYDQEENWDSASLRAAKVEAAAWGAYGSQAGPALSQPMSHQMPQQVRPAQQRSPHRGPTFTRAREPSFAPTPPPRNLASQTFRPPVTPEERAKTQQAFRQGVQQADREYRERMEQERAEAEARGRPNAGTVETVAVREMGRMRIREEEPLIDLGSGVGERRSGANGEGGKRRIFEDVFHT